MAYTGSASRAASTAGPRCLPDRKEDGCDRGTDLQGAHRQPKCNRHFGHRQGVQSWTLVLKGSVRYLAHPWPAPSGPASTARACRAAPALMPPPSRRPLLPGPAPRAAPKSARRNLQHLQQDARLHSRAAA